MRAATIASAEIRLSETARSRGMQRLNQSALSEVADVSAAGALDHVDGELEQADFPGIVYALDDGAERFGPVLNMRLCARDDGFNRIAKHLLSYVSLSKLKSVADAGHIVAMFAQLIGVTFRFLAKPFQQQPAEMFRRENLRTVGVNFSVADAHFIYPIHQFRNQIQSKTGRAEGGDLLFGRENHLSVFNRVLEIVFLHVLG